MAISREKLDASLRVAFSLQGISRKVTEDTDLLIDNLFEGEFKNILSNFRRDITAVREGKEPPSEVEENENQSAKEESPKPSTPESVPHGEPLQGVFTEQTLLSSQGRRFTEKWGISTPGTNLNLTGDAKNHEPNSDDKSLSFGCITAGAQKPRSTISSVGGLAGIDVKDNKQPEAKIDQVNADHPDLGGDHSNAGRTSEVARKLEFIGGAANETRGADEMPPRIGTPEPDYLSDNPLFQANSQEGSPARPVPASQNILSQPKTLSNAQGLEFNTPPQTPTRTPPQSPACTPVKAEDLVKMPGTVPGSLTTSPYPALSPQGHVNVSEQDNSLPDPAQIDSAACEGDQKDGHSVMDVDSPVTGEPANKDKADADKLPRKEASLAEKSESNGAGGQAEPNADVQKMDVDVGKKEDAVTDAHKTPLPPSPRRKKVRSCTNSLLRTKGSGSMKKKRPDTPRPASTGRGSLIESGCLLSTRRSLFGKGGSPEKDAQVEPSPGVREMDVDAGKTEDVVLVETDVNKTPQPSSPRRKKVRSCTNSLLRTKGSGSMKKKRPDTPRPASTGRRSLIESGCLLSTRRSLFGKGGSAENDASLPCKALFQDEGPKEELKVDNELMSPPPNRLVSPASKSAQKKQPTFVKEKPQDSKKMDIEMAESVPLTMELDNAPVRAVSPVKDDSAVVQTSPMVSPPLNRPVVKCDNQLMSPPPNRLVSPAPESAENKEEPATFCVVKPEDSKKMDIEMAESVPLTMELDNAPVRAASPVKDASAVVRTSPVAPPKSEDLPVGNPVPRRPSRIPTPPAVVVEKGTANVLQKGGSSRLVSSKRLSAQRRNSRIPVSPIIKKKEHGKKGESGVLARIRKDLKTTTEGAAKGPGADRPKNGPDNIVTGVTSLVDRLKRDKRETKVAAGQHKVEVHALKKAQALRQQQEQKEKVRAERRAKMQQRRETRQKTMAMEQDGNIPGGEKRGLKRPNPTQAGNAAKRLKEPTVAKQTAAKPGPKSILARTAAAVKEKVLGTKPTPAKTSKPTKVAGPSSLTTPAGKGSKMELPKVTPGEYELTPHSELDPDDYDKEYRKDKHIPRWAKGMELESALMQQVNTNPDEIFRRQESIDLMEVFGDPYENAVVRNPLKRKNRYLKRTDSADFSQHFLDQ